MTQKISYLCLFLLAVSCFERLPSTTVESFKIPLDSITSSQTDYLLLAENNNRFYIKSLINNSFEVYDWNTKQKTGSIHTPRNLIQGGRNQSLTYVNQDTLLILQRNNGHLFYANEYGHIYNDWDIGLRSMPHFSITTNPPIYFQGKLYVSIVPEISNKEYDFVNNLYAIEYVLDVINQTIDQITLVLPKQNNLFLSGLRHNIATRTFANGQLNYIWGGGSSILQLDIIDQTHKIFNLPIKDITLTSYQKNYSEHKEQQEYYFKHQVYDHISYDSYREVYYVYLLDASLSAYHKYQRGFTIFKLNENFQLIAKKHFMKEKYVFDNELITKQGLYLSSNNPFSHIHNENIMNYNLITIQE